MYDSAHAFSVKKDNKSILNQGNLCIELMQQRYLTRLREEQSLKQPRDEKENR